MQAKSGKQNLEQRRLKYQLKPLRSLCKYDEYQALLHWLRLREMSVVSPIWLCKHKSYAYYELSVHESTYSNSWPTPFEYPMLDLLFAVMPRNIFLGTCCQFRSWGYSFANHIVTDKEEDEEEAEDEEEEVGTLFPLGCIGNRYSWYKKGATTSHRICYPVRKRKRCIPR